MTPAPEPDRSDDAAARTAADAGTAAAPATVPADDGPLRPAQVLLPGRHDARRLLILWWVRKSAYWLSFTGTTAAYLIGRPDEAGVDWTAPDSILAGLWSPWAGIVLAVLIRVLSGFVAMAFAYPVVRRYLRTRSPRTGLTSGIGKMLDLRGLVLAHRRLRWSHHVREAALDRLGPSGLRLGRLDPLLDVANVASFVLMVVVIVTAGVPG